MRRFSTPLGSTPPTIYEQQCGEQWKSFLDRAYGFGEDKNVLRAICECHYKGSPFWVSVQKGFELMTSNSADQCFFNWANRAAAEENTQTWQGFPCPLVYQVEGMLA